MKKLIYIAFLLFLSSCFKEEDPRNAFINFETIVIGNEYENQLFYSLNDTSIVSSNDYRIWDLGFYSKDDAFFIRLNAAANMWAVKQNSNDFYATYSSAVQDSSLRFDGSHGLNDNLAIDIYVENENDQISDEVYLIHPGVDANGVDLGEYYKFQWLGIYNGAYVFHYAYLDGSNYYRDTIVKNPYVNYQCYSMKTNSQQTIEPDNSTWDLLFTRFTDTVYTTDGTDFIAGYAVTGAYLNTNSVEAYLEEDIAYEDFDLNSIDYNRFSSYLNVIGHDWKRFLEQYYIVKNKTYIIKDRDGRYFKLRFLSFYDTATGAKGYPAFEFELL